MNFELFNRKLELGGASFRVGEGVISTEGKDFLNDLICGCLPNMKEISFCWEQTLEYIKTIRPNNVELRNSAVDIFGIVLELYSDYTRGLHFFNKLDLGDLCGLKFSFGRNIQNAKLDISASNCHNVSFFEKAKNVKAQLNLGESSAQSIGREALNCLFRVNLDSENKRNIEIGSKSNNSSFIIDDALMLGGDIGQSATNSVFIITPSDPNLSALDANACLGESSSGSIFLVSGKAMVSTITKSEDSLYIFNGVPYFDNKVLTANNMDFNAKNRLLQFISENGISNTSNQVDDILTRLKKGNLI